MLHAALTVKFECLDNRTVVEAKVSDHNPLLYRSSLGLRFCTFNMLMQCVTGNNGFMRIETVEEYQQRLCNTIAMILVELSHKHKVDFLLLQEAPPPGIGSDFYNKIRLSIPSLIVDEHNMYRQVLSLSSGENFLRSGVMLLYPRTFNATELTDQLITNISDANQDRFQAFSCSDAQNGLIFNIANFHGDYKNQAGTQADLHYLLQRYFLIGGDFNLLQLPEVSVPQVAAATIAGLFPQQTYDAIFDAA